MAKALQCAEDGMAYPILTPSQQEELAKPCAIEEEKDEHSENNEEELMTRLNN